MKKFNFPRTIKRKLFNIIFGGVGKRRLVTDFTPKYSKKPKRIKMQKLRRSHQGWRNRIYGSITAQKIRKVFGRRKPIGNFRYERK